MFVYTEEWTPYVYACFGAGRHCNPDLLAAADTRDCPAGEKTFSLQCALEKATDEVRTSFEHRGAAMQEARVVIDDIAPKAENYDHRLMDYNPICRQPSPTFRSSSTYCRNASPRD